MADSEEFILAEYETLRRESSDARVAQQQTIGWSLAAFGAVFGGGLVFATAELTSGQWSSPSARHVFIGLFGFVIPTLVFFAFLAYLGELRRMERVGGYIRALEAQVAKLPLTPHTPLRWESFLLPPQGKGKSSKLWESYIGVAGIYGFTLVASWVMTIAGSFDGSAWTGAASSLSRLDLLGAAVDFWNELFNQPHMLARVATAWSLLFLLLFFICGISAASNRWKVLPYPPKEWVVDR